MPDQRAMSAKTKLLIGTVFGALVAIAAVAPFLLMLLPNPVPVRVGDVAAQPSGAYITTGGTTYHVFARAEQVDVFPADSPVVNATAVVSIKSDQLDQPSAYSLFDINGNGVDVTRTNVRTNILELRPTSPLPPGRYYAQIARDGMFGGTDYVYFSVAGTQGASAQ